MSLRCELSQGKKNKKKKIRVSQRVKIKTELDLNGKLVKDNSTLYSCPRRWMKTFLHSNSCGCYH